MRTLAMVTILFLYVACNGSDSFIPTEVRTPNIVGTYASATFLEVEIRDHGVHARVTCPGRLVVADQAGPNWSGSWILEAAPGCSAGSSPISGGYVTAGGLIEFTGGLREQLIDPGGFFQGCTAVESSARFRGSVSGSSLNASGSVLYDCPFSEYLQSLTFSMQGTRS
jgi:hypothetical protein